MVAMWQWAHFTTLSGQGDFFWPMILRGVGLGLVFVPLTNLALGELPMEKIPNGTGLFNLLRQLGGSVGIALSATLLTRFQAAHHAALAEHVTRFDELTRGRLVGVTGSLVAHGMLPGVAQRQAVALMDAQVTRQAFMLSFEQ